MPRIWSKAVPEGYGLAPHQEKFECDQLTLADVVYRFFKEIFDKQMKIMSHFDQQDEKLGELMEMTR